jgi:hypothetical protein
LSVQNHKLARFNDKFRQTLNPARDQPDHYQIGNSKSVPWLSLFLQSNKPAGWLGEARQSGNRDATAGLAVLSKWASIF